MSDITLKQLLEVGAHFGHQSRRWNPAMKQYIFGERDGIHIFDLAKTKAGLDAACEAAAQVARAGGKVLFVGTKRQAAALVKEQAIRAGMPYVSVRWMGGMLTNFAQLSKSLRKLADLKEKRASGELKKYTKREQLLIDKDIAKLERFLGGVVSLDKLPQAMFVVDTHKEEVAVREGVRTGIPVIGLVDSNSDPELVDYPVPMNDDAVKAVELAVTAVADAIIKTQKSEEAKIQKVKE